MMKMFSMILLAALLAGCIGRQEASVPTASFDFAPVAVNGSHPLPKVEVFVPAWLNTQGVQYRLLYRDANELREYAYARWAGAPSALVQQRLRSRLAGSPAFAGACWLQVHLDEFSQSFSSPERSSGELRGEVRLLDQQRKVLATRYLALSQPAATPDVRGGVNALASAVDQIAEAVRAFSNEDKRLAACMRPQVANATNR